MQYMRGYKKPWVRDQPELSIAHVATNDLSSKVSSKLIVDIAISLKTESNDASVSNIILITDNPLLSQKRCEIYLLLINLCED